MASKKSPKSGERKFRSDVLILIAAFVVLLIVYFKSKAPALQPTPVANKTAKSAATPSPALPETPADKPASSETTSERTKALIKQNEELNRPRKIPLGVCRFEGQTQGSAQKNLLPLSIYDHITEQNPSHVLIPTFHAKCLQAESNGLFQIVQYDAQTDWTFEHLGESQINLRFVKKISGYVEILMGGEKVIRQFGFANNAAITDYLARLGAGGQDELSVYQITSKGSTRARNPACGYSFFPGLKVVEKMPAASNATKIYLRSNVPSKKTSSEISLRIPVLSHQLISPASLIAKLPLPAEIQEFAKETPLLLIANDREDLQSLNFGIQLLVNGFQNITVVGEGERGIAGEITLTPPSIPSFKTESVEFLIANLAKGLVLDVRKFNTTFRFAKAEPSQPPSRPPSAFEREAVVKGGRFQIPFKIPADEVARLVRHASQGEIFVIGRDECDWAAPQIAQALVDSGVPRVNWIRAGMESVQLMNRLKILKGVSSGTFGASSDLQAKRITLPPNRNRPDQPREAIILQRGTKPEK